MNRNFLFLSALTSLFNLLYAGNAQSAAADIDQYYDHDLDRALANSLADPGGGAGQEEADLQEAIRRSNAELSKRPTSSKAVTKNPFLQHVASLVTASDLKDGNYIGKNKEVEKLFQQPDYETWHQAFLTYGIKGGGKPTGLEIVYFLQTLQESQLNREINALVNHALLEIISGCWGFTKDPVDPAVITRIKGILKGVAQYTATDLTEDAFNQKVTSVAALEKFKGDSSFHSHYAEVLSCLNEGFFEGKPERVYDLLELQTAMLMSFGLDGTHYTKVFTKAGYYVDDQITVDQLVETAFHRGSSIKVNKAQTTELQRYLGSWDADSPGISSNLENLKLFQALIAAQPLANRYSVEAVKQRLLDKLDHLKDWAEDDKKVLAEILFEALRQDDFIGQQDRVYEKVLRDDYETFENIDSVTRQKVQKKRTYQDALKLLTALND